MKIKPLNDWVLIESGEAEEMSPGGILIPQVAKEKPQWGVVLAVGPGAYRSEKKKGKKEEKKFVPTEVKPGEKVLYEKYMAKEFETGGQKITMVREEYVLGVLSSDGESTSLQKKAPSEIQKKATGALEKTKKRAAAKPKARK